MHLHTTLFTLTPLLLTASALPSLFTSTNLQPRQLNWPACQTDLSCTFADIESASMQARLDFVMYMQIDHFAPLNASDRFRAIEGVIVFFLSENLGAPGSWISYVDAGIVEGIQRGGAIALGYSTETGGNPGSQVWATYFAGQRRPGGYPDRQSHDFAWGQAEATATEWAKETQADIYANAPATRRELNWYEFTKIFRWIMRNERTTIILLTPIFLTRSDDFVYWLTDVTRREPAICGSEAAWAISGTLSFADLLQLPANIVALFRAIYDCGRDFIENS